MKIGMLLVIGALSLSLLAGCDNSKSKKLSMEKKLELAEKCSKLGKAYFDDFNRHTHSGYFCDEPEYHHNNRLNTCLIHIPCIEWTDKKASLFRRNQVIDIFANKVIPYGWFDRNVVKGTETLVDTPNKEIPNYTSEEYYKRKDQLFSE
jgi:hypothetical protein